MVSCGVVDVEEGCDDCFNVCVFVFVVVKEEVEEGRERERRQVDIRWWLLPSFLQSRVSRGKR